MLGGGAEDIGELIGRQQARLKWDCPQTGRSWRLFFGSLGLPSRYRGYTERVEAWTGATE